MAAGCRRVDPYPRREPAPIIPTPARPESKESHPPWKTPSWPRNWPALVLPGRSLGLDMVPGISGAGRSLEAKRGTGNTRGRLRPNPTLSGTNSLVSPVDRKRLLTAPYRAGPLSQPSSKSSMGGAWAVLGPPCPIRRDHGPPECPNEVTRLSVQQAEEWSTGQSPRGGSALGAYSGDHLAEGLLRLIFVGHRVASLVHYLAHRLLEFVLRDQIHAASRPMKPAIPRCQSLAERDRALQLCSSDLVDGES